MLHCSLEPSELVSHIWKPWGKSGLPWDKERTRDPSTAPSVQEP
jgi:hypothetical protein